MKKMIKKGLDALCKQCKSNECGYSSKSECPFSNPEKCSYDKRNCHLMNKENEKKNPNAVSCRIMICALVGFIIYILCILLEQVLDFPYSREVYFIISGICQSLLAAAVLAIVIDIPSKLEDYKSSIIEALSSDSYLKMLEESKLTLLRKKVTEQLNKMSAPNMPKGLIEKDQWICELLRKPYYSRYRHFVSCSDIDGDDNFILKKHNINYKLINPYGKHKEMTEHIKVTNLVYLHDISEESINDMKISCTIDGGTKREYIPGTDFDFKKEPFTESFYNTKVSIKMKENKSFSPEEIAKGGIPVRFKEHIQVEISYTIKVAKRDICFTKRLQHPAKNFELCYSYERKNGRLCGQIFGTDIKQSDVNIHYINDNNICMTTFDWLLPNNGAMIVMLND